MTVSSSSISLASDLARFSVKGGRFLDVGRVLLFEEQDTNSDVAST